jgi:hypothetical protein
MLIFKEFLLVEATELSSDTLKVLKKFSSAGSNGYKLIAIIDGKSKTLNAGNPEGGGDDDSKFIKKFNKFISETPSFTLNLKMPRSGPMGSTKWLPVGDVEVIDNKVTSEKWYR